MPRLHQLAVFVQGARILDLALRDKDVRFSLLSGSLPWIENIQPAVQKSTETLKGIGPQIMTKGKANASIQSDIGGRQSANHFILCMLFERTCAAFDIYSLGDLMRFLGILVPLQIG